MLEDGMYYRQETYVYTLSDALSVTRDLIIRTSVVELVYFEHDDKTYTFKRKDIDKIDKRHVDR